MNETVLEIQSRAAALAGVMDARNDAKTALATAETARAEAYQAYQVTLTARDQAANDFAAADLNHDAALVEFRNFIDSVINAE